MMPKEIMTLEEVAGYFRISERTVKDWVGKGKIPGGKLGTSWRFKRSEIIKWVDSQLVPQNKMSINKESDLSSFIQKERITFLDVDNKTDALNKLINLSADIPGIDSEEELSKAIFKREELMSTGIGLGIGVPHVRLPNVKNFHITIGVCKKEILDYKTIDDIPIRIIVMIIGVLNQQSQHIQLLSKIAKLLKINEIRQKILFAETIEQIYNIIIYQES